MLVLSRRIGERIVLPEMDVSISVVGVQGKRVQLGIDAPHSTSVHREEVCAELSVWPTIPLLTSQLARSCDRLLRERMGKESNPVRDATSKRKVARMGTDTGKRQSRPGNAAESVLLETRRRLGAAGYRVLRQIECEYSGGVLVLRGSVPTFYLKQIAQSVLLNNPIVERVVNLIDVPEGVPGEPLTGDAPVREACARTDLAMLWPQAAHTTAGSPGFLAACGR